MSSFLGFQECIHSLDLRVALHIYSTFVSKGSFTPNVSVDACGDVWKQYMEVSCTIHTEC